MAIKHIFTCLVLTVLLTGCNPLVVNHYANRGSNPVDGAKVGSSVYADAETVYPEENLSFLKNKNDLDYKKYYASAKMYHTDKYNVSNVYMKDYTKLLAVDADDLENRLKEEQFNIPSGELLRKMETGTAMQRPIEGNVREMQYLKEEQKVVAYPDYMVAYLDPYVKRKQAKEVVVEQESDFIATSHTDKKLEGDVRTAYVDYFLQWSAETNNEDREYYKERPLK